MKKKLPTIILICVFFIGLGLMLYPVVSNLVNRAHQTYAIDSYNRQIAKMSKKDFQSILKDARSYNLTITANEFPRNQSDLDGNNDYQAAINPSGNGMIGYLKIDSIKLRMPIYHTTKESVLQVGVGHIPTTSLPVGGKSTHAVLTGHRGLPSAKLFTDLDKVKIGDVFYIYVLNDILAYKVDQIKTVLPENTSDLEIVQGKDYVSLVTCTPYGINTHRLVVRGERVPYESTVEIDGQPKDSDRVYFLKQIMMASFILLFFILTATITFIIILRKGRRTA